MDYQLLRRVIPLVFGARVALAALFADNLLFPVAVIGGILVGLMYILTSGRSGRDRSRRRSRV